MHFCKKSTFFKLKIFCIWGFWIIRFFVKKNVNIGQKNSTLRDPCYFSFLYHSLNLIRILHAIIQKSCLKGERNKSNRLDYDKRLFMCFGVYMEEKNILFRNQHKKICVLQMCFLYIFHRAKMTSYFIFFFVNEIIQM